MASIGTRLIRVKGDRESLIDAEAVTRACRDARSRSSRRDVTRNADGALPVDVANPVGASGQLGPRRPAVRTYDCLVK